MSELIQGQNTKSRFRLTPLQPVAKSLPTGAAVDGSSLATPAGGSRLTLQIAGALAFDNELSFGNLGSLRLLTTGFEEFETQQTDNEIAPLEEGIPEPAAPPAATKPFEIALCSAAPPPASLIQDPEPVALPSPELLLPQSPLQTLRRKMKLGPDPNARVAEVKAEVKPDDTKAESKADIKSTKPVAAATVKAPPPPAPKPAVSVVKPVAKGESKPEAAAPKKAAAPEKPKISIKPPEPQTAPAEKKPAAPAVTAREAPAPTPQPIRKEAAASEAPEKKPYTMIDAPVLSMGVADSGGSSKVKIGIIAAALVVVAGVGSLMYSGKKDSMAAASAGSSSSTSGAGLVIGGGGWSTNWGAEAPINKDRQISIYRPSTSLTDYRFEFRGQIERKAMGWVFRAANPKNYYVAKLEVVKPGLNPVVALVKYAVINGKEGTHTQVLLPSDLKVRPDTTYGVRMDVKGNTFTTYVQDKLVDVWTDDQVKTGGVGFHTEKGERAGIKSSQVIYLGSGS